MVTEEEIRTARRLVETLEGISPCFSASAAVAGLAQLARRGVVDGDQTVLVNLTGADRGDLPAADRTADVHWMRRSGNEWVSDDEEVAS